MQEYKNDELTARYDPKICIHAGEWLSASKMLIPKVLMLFA
jgi:hypothetical protein